MRLENIADLIDFSGGLEQSNIFVRVKDLALQLYKAVNGPDSEVMNINISEKSLTGNMDITQMNKRKVLLRGEDDEMVGEVNLPKDRPNFEVSLTAQRIRTFLVEFVPLVRDYNGLKGTKFLEKI